MTEPFQIFFGSLRFEDLALHESIQLAIREAGFERLTLIQEKCLPPALEGRDVAAQSQTGTGKTAAFLLTIFQRLLAGPASSGGKPRALVVAPTRELALQIRDDAESLGKHTGLKIAAIYGGTGYHEQARTLAEGTDLVIGTPGRLIDYMKKDLLPLDKTGIVVIDEADRMFDMGFIFDLRRILHRLPPPGARQSMLFSATLNLRVMELAYEHMNCPLEISSTPERITADTVEEALYHVAAEEKLPLLLGLLQTEQPEKTLIFANTRASAEWVARKLRGNGLKAEFLSSDIPQTQRVKIVHRFKEGDLAVLVATDVASRGLHVEGISHVVNYDLPQDAEDYVHRIGRTARVGQPGRALSLVCDRYVYSLEAIETLIGHKIPVTQPEEELFMRDISPPVRIHRTGGANRSGPARGKQGGSGGNRGDRRTRRPGRGRSTSAPPPPGAAPAPR